MDSSLLATSLRVPPPRDHLVHRPRLLANLTQALASHKLVLVSAAAGYGKTTLLAQWAHSRRHAIAWVTLSDAENDAERLLRYLVAAWGAVQPAVLESPVGLLLGAMSPQIDTVLTAFINAADAAPAPLTFILDDLHLLHDDAVLHALTFLLDHLPPRHRFVLAGRTDPPLPLARYRARGELGELRAADLQFDRVESAELLNGLLDLGLAESELVALHDQVEGWAAGLQLAALPLRHRQERASLPARPGLPRFIADYLRGDVLAHLSPDVQRFLLQTCILDSLCAPLCDAVTEGSGSQQVLERLERENLFLAPLDDHRDWFRYHPLFAEVLRHELQRHYPHEVAQFHRRAACWYLGAALPEQAFQHAVAGEDLDLMTRIGEDYAVIKMESGELNVVARWVAMIPERWYASHPAVNLLRVTYLIFTGSLDESVRLLDDVESRLRHAPSADQQEVLPKVAMIRCAIACFENDLPGAEAYAAQALSALPADDRIYRASIYHALGDTYSRNAYWHEAKAAYLQCLEIVHPPSARIRSVHIYGALADLELRQGHRMLAAEYWRKALAVIQERQMWGRLPIPVTGWVAIRLGELSYERNDLDDAREHLRHGLELAHLGGDVRSLIAGHLLSARLHLTAGDCAGAAAALEQARALLNQAHFPEWQSRLRRWQLELWFALGRPPAAMPWLSTPTAADDDTTDAAMIDRLTLARARIMNARQPDNQQARQILRRVIAMAATHGRQGLEIEALALDALAWWAAGDRASALIPLERALRLAEPEGYLRLFADLGPPMTLLLQEATRRHVLPAYVQTLLETCAAGAPGSEAALLEPLTEREQEVLQLLAAGLTNREIAAVLFISAETVKKHAGRIYAKLATSRRTQAIARARELGLLNHTP